mmetsp:Transcript_25084/g.56932  ORF Transcript_25084/g.56932 Transcript_25084/m.56932 type:complete len:218 (+) Transcript_25084:524-1177(+)
MSGSQLLDLSLHGIDSTLFSTGSLSGIVRVAPYACPSRYWLRVIGHTDMIQLADALQDVARNPQVVSGSCARTRPHLELPLARRYLGVDTTDLHTCEEAGAVVAFHYVAAHSFSSTCSTVVGIVSTRIIALRPPQRPVVVGVQKVILLLDAEPRVITSCAGSGHHLFASSPGVVLCRRAERLAASQSRLFVRVGQHKDVVSAAKGVPVDPPRHEVDV